MGRIFLVMIAVGLVWGGYQVYSNITGLTDGEALSKRYQGSQSSAPEQASQVNTQAEKEPVSVTPEKKEEVDEWAKDPLPVVSKNCEWLQIEAWTIVRAGEELPDGSRLESWDESAAIAVTTDGRRQRLRFRRANEALALVAKTIASTATAEVALPWQSGKKE